MSAQWINTIGLVADIIGVSLLSWGLFVGKEKAIELGASRWAGGTDDENLALPAVVDRFGTIPLCDVRSANLGGGLWLSNLGNLDKVGTR